MELSLGFSPCPNDTFIFDALIHRRIDSGNYRFNVVLDDVGALNRKAFQATLDITKLSYHAYLFVNDKYQMLHSGSALGSGVGPLLITRNENIDFCRNNISSITIAVPGQYTTANFLLQAIFGNHLHTKNYLFSDIEQAVINGEVDAGVIIHENRFTYHQKGLAKIIDLGEAWETQTKQLIPLGGIAVKRSLPEKVKQDINRLIRQSIRFAFDNPQYALPFIRENAQEMSPEVMQKHIDLYVNQYSLDLGTNGQQAIKYMFDFAKKQKLINDYNSAIFVNQNKNLTL